MTRLVVVLHSYTAFIITQHESKGFNELLEEIGAPNKIGKYHWGSH